MLRGRNEWVRWEKRTTRSLGEKTLVVVSLPHLVISTRRRKPQSAVWSGPGSDILTFGKGWGSEAGSRLVRPPSGAWGCQYPPAYHVRVAYPLRQSTPGSLPLWFFPEHSRSCLLFLEGKKIQRRIYLSCG